MVEFDKKRLEVYKAEVHKLGETLAKQIREKAAAYGVAEETEKLVKTFSQCFVNTVDTTVKCLPEEEVFLITGDIEAMWLRDSSAQVAHYMPYLTEYPLLAQMVKGLVLRQFRYIEIDPYANAFNVEANGRCWTKDDTEDTPWDWERKYEIDSLAYPIRLLYDYWKATGDKEIFTEQIHRTLHMILDLFQTEQHHTEKSGYYFRRENCPVTDTLACDGKGTPVGYTGMIWCGFRPSDDACQYGYLIPANLFAAEVLNYVVEIADIYGDKELAERALVMKKEILDGVEKYGKVNHPVYGEIYAYEVDGLGNVNLMDDANVPSLLSLPWLRCLEASEPVYQNTRKFVLSKENPFYYEGTAAKGIGSPHTPPSYVWHIALSMQGLTSVNAEEKKELLQLLLHTDAGTGYMHEGFDCNDPEKFTRDWFAWSNSLFALYVLTYFELY